MEFQEYYGWIKGTVNEVKVEIGAITALVIAIEEIKEATSENHLPSDLLGRTFETSALAFEAGLEGREVEGGIQTGQKVSGILQYLLLERGQGGEPDVESWIFSLDAVE